MIMYWSIISNTLFSPSQLKFKIIFVDVFIHIPDYLPRKHGSFIQHCFDFIKIVWVHFKSGFSHFYILYPHFFSCMSYIYIYDFYQQLQWCYANFTGNWYRNLQSILMVNSQLTMLCILPLNLPLRL
jgi:hypothetical protein